MHMTIHSKILLFIVAPIILLYVVIAGYGQWQYSENEKSRIRDRMSELTGRNASILDANLSRAADVARLTAGFLETEPDLSEAQLYAQLHRNVTSNPLVYGAAIAFEPGRYQDRKLFSPYVYRTGTGTARMDIATEAYDYTDGQWQWWDAPRDTGTSVWTAPYFDEGAGNILMSTYTTPFFSEGTFRGVTTVDVDLKALSGQLEDTDMLARNFFIVTNSGHIAYHYDRWMIGKSFVEIAAESGNTGNIALSQRIMAGQTGMMSIESDDGNGTDWVFYAPIPSAGWGLAMRLNKDVAMAFIRNQALERAGFFLLSLLMIGLLVSFVTRRITQPIEQLSDRARDIAEGRLDVDIVSNSRDEIGDLSRTFCEMAINLSQREQDLKDQADKLERRVEQRTLELKQAERMASESKQRLLGITDSVPGVVYQAVIGPEGDLSFRFISDGVSELFGVDRQAAIKDADLIMKAVLPEDMEALRHSIRSSGLKLQPWSQEFRIRMQDGSIKWIHGESVPRQAEDGKLIWNGYWIDMTERKEMEEDLSMAKEAADIASQAKSHFLANMSHEIRTPMNAIIGLSHLALKTELNEKQTDYLVKISSSAQALLGIINDILDYSKIEAGKLDMEAIPFELPGVLDNLSSMIALKTSDKGLEFLIDVESGLPDTLIGDPLRLGQVLLNLTNNAVKFTEHGEITLSIRSQEESDDSITLLFSIQDTGIGLSVEQKERLFESFSQADGSTTRHYGGTGLGLAICKRLVAMMGGEIDVKSKPGEGSNFYFTAVFGRIPEKPETKLRTVPNLQDIRVLIVDDNPTSRDILRRYAESFGMIPGEAASGEEAIHELRVTESGNAYRMVLMDWKMDGMNGIETARRIKADTNLTVQPAIVMVSAYGREELMQQSQDLGLDGYLIKPVNPSMLFDTIMHVFEEHKDSKEPAVRPDMEPDTPLSKAHILLVEDNPINQQVAQELLESAGLILKIAGNGQEAVDLVRKENFDGVFMDLQMPVMDGFEATRTIREDLRKPDLPIIAMTANAMSGDRDRCLTAGMNDYVCKPIDPDELFNIIRKWFSTTATGEQRSAPSSRGVTDSPSSAELEDLPGFDTTAGLRRLQGNRKLYMQLIRDFASNYEDVGGRIGVAIGAHDWEEAHSLIHNLKGLAGNLSATTLHKAAVELETAVKAPGHPPEAITMNLARLLEALTQALESARRLPQSEPRTGTTTESPPVEPELAREVAERIRELVDIGDVMALSEVSKELPEDSYEARRIRELANNFDLDGLLVLAEELDRIPSPQG